jgi:hypothetical protein
MAHYKKYTQLHDSSFRVTKIRQAEELQVMYQTEEKENQIALLNQQAKLEQANLKQATLVKNMTIAGTHQDLLCFPIRSPKELFKISRLRLRNYGEKKASV